MDMSTAADWHKAFTQKIANSAQYRRLCGIARMVFGAGRINYAFYVGNGRNSKEKAARSMAF